MHDDKEVVEEEMPSFFSLFLDHRHFSHGKNVFRVMNLPLKLMVGGSVVLIVFHINIHPATRARNALPLIDLAYLAILPTFGPSIARVRFINDGN